MRFLPGCWGHYVAGLCDQTIGGLVSFNAPRAVLSKWTCLAMEKLAQGATGSK